MEDPPPREMNRVDGYSSSAFFPTSRVPVLRRVQQALLSEQLLCVSLRDETYILCHCAARSRLELITQGWDYSGPD